MNNNLWKRRALWLMLIALAIVVAACAPAAAEPGDENGGAEPAGGIRLDEIIDVDWDLVELAGQAPAAGSRATLVFSGVDLSGSTGCNGYFAGYTLEDDRLTVSEVGQTEMWCEGLMDQEQAFLEALRSAERVSLEDGRLTIHTGEGDLLFQPAVSLTLEGQGWILNGIMVGDGFVSTYLDDAITAEFKEGRMAGSAGCNQYFANYEADSATLTLGPVGSTRMACDEEHNQRESEFLSALAGVAGFEIQRDVLTLTGSDGGTLIQFRAAR